LAAAGVPRRERAGLLDASARRAQLCSEEASYITGTTLTRDGGFTLTI